ncbi:MAG: RimK family alpha-L-glutamate ligase [Candidatus Woesearchaeota archaeon]
MRAALISLGSVSSRWTHNAMNKYFDHVDHLNIKKIQISLGTKTPTVLYEGKPVEQYDCIYAKGSFRYSDVLGALRNIYRDSAYMPISSTAFAVGHDKVLSQIEMQRYSIPMPVTYLSSSVKAAKEILEQITYPIIMKLPKGTQGKGVMFAESYASASSLLDTLTALRQPFLIQEFVDTSGEDIRAIVVGDKVVAAMRRVAKENESRANVHAGGTTQPCILDTNTQKIAVNAAKAIGAEICGVDILESAKGPVVIEVNLSPGLQGVTNCTNVDVSDHIAKYLYERTKQKIEGSKKQQADHILQDAGISEPETGKEIITNLDLRNNKILLPELYTKITHFNEEDEVIISVKKGHLEIKGL